LSAAEETVPPKPDREAVEDVVLAFLEDAARKDVEAVCDALTGVGRASGGWRAESDRPSAAAGIEAVLC
jgi:hypothetical protein